MTERKLPESWQWKRLSQIAEINPEETRASTWTDDTLVSFISMAAIDETAGLIREVATQPYQAISSGKTRFRAGDILFAKITPCVENGKIALIKSILSEIGFGSTEFYVVRPSRHVLAEYLVGYLRTEGVRQAAADAMVGTTGRQRVPSSFMTALPIPVPPIAEQKEIVRILERADDLLQLRAESEKLSEQILPALFTETFGDPSTNPKGWEVKTLGDIVTSKSGGTPSRTVEDFWSGEIPWVSPSDMKVSDLHDAAEHITQRALSESAVNLVEPGTILVVVRSGILAHTLPVAIARVPLTFNQDIRALIPTSVVCSEYLLWVLRLMEPRILASVVRHGSTVHNIDSVQLFRLAVPVPPLLLQRSFAAQLEQITKVRRIVAEANNTAQVAYDRLVPRAFIGELTSGWRQRNSTLCITEPIFARRQEVVLALLDELAEQKRQEVLLTQMMKYLFLTQMEGGREAGVNRLCRFEPHLFGPFDKELYADLELLSKEKVIETEWRPKAAKPKEEFMLIRLTQNGTQIAQRIAGTLDERLRQVISQIVTEFGHLTHDQLLERVYHRYPRYAKRTLRRRLVKK